MKMKTMRLGVVCGLAASGVAQAGSTFEHGYEFLPIRDAGNALPSFEDPLFGETIHGAVDYEFRISKSLTTATQWAAFASDFSDAFGSAEINGVDLDDVWIGEITPSGLGFGPLEGYERNAIRNSWRAGAMYCNWLHNGKTADPQGFLTGAYDTSTFSGTSVFGDPATDRFEKLDGARYWMPTVDEWFKAAYYDPNRFGEGEGGYWSFPDASDTPLIGAPPEEGGESDTFFYPGQEYPTGSYPHVQSAYGLIDLSGSAKEWTSSEVEDIGQVYRVSTVARMETFDVYDRIDFPLFFGHPGSTSGGFRIATNIPAPAGTGLQFLCLYAVARRRRSTSSYPSN